MCLLLLGYPKVIPNTKFEHFGIIRFALCSGQTNKQTDKQTDRLEHPTRDVLKNLRSEEKDKDKDLRLEDKNKDLWSKDKEKDL